jgi:hypothetical protein
MWQAGLLSETTNAKDDSQTAQTLMQVVFQLCVRHMACCYFCYFCYLAGTGAVTGRSSAVLLTAQQKKMMKMTTMKMTHGGGQTRQHTGKHQLAAWPAAFSRRAVHTLLQLQL